MSGHDEIYLLEDYYLSRTKELVDQFLIDSGYARELLVSLPEEEVRSLISQALEYAAHQIARTESMIHLGQKDYDTKMQETPHKPHSDRLERHFRQNKS